MILNDNTALSKCNFPFWIFLMFLMCVYSLIILTSWIKIDNSFDILRQLKHSSREICLARWSCDARHLIVFHLLFTRRDYLATTPSSDQLYVQLVSTRNKYRWECTDESFLEFSEFFLLSVQISTFYPQVEENIHTVLVILRVHFLYVWLVLNCT